MESSIEIPDLNWGVLGLQPGCSVSDPNCQTCILDGFETDCGRINWEATEQCPDNDCGPRTIYDPNSGKNVGVLPLGRDPNTGQWMVSGTIDQYQRVPITVREEDSGIVISSSPGKFQKIGTTTFAGFLDPQKPGPGSFWDCLGKAGLKGTNFNPDAADLVRRISQAEGTAQELLAYTWMKEAVPAFNPRPAPNTDTDPNDPLRWDYGPFQLNAYWTNKMIEKGEIKTDGIAGGSALGGHGAKAGQPFEGDPFENGRLAARILNFHGTGETAAGAFTGGSRVADRSKAYREWAPRFKNFFDCWKN